MAQRDAAGLEYLDLVSVLLRRARLADPYDGLWEAADLQWWWRRDQHHDPADATFWIGDDGLPRGAVVFTDWGDRRGCTVIALPGDTVLPRAELWPHAFERMACFTTAPIEVDVRDDDTETPALLAYAGLVRDDGSVMTCWMMAGDRTPITPLAAGYRVFSTAERAADPHQMVARSGADVADRLRECSLYDPALDLYITADDGEIAGYGLFWADPVTGVGLVEPMRTEDAHQHRGLAAHLLQAGLDRLADRGCTTLKVSYYEANQPARLLYIGAGFQPVTRTWTYRRSPAGVKEDP